MELISSHKGLRSLSLRKRSRVFLGILDDNPLPSAPAVARCHSPNVGRRPRDDTEPNFRHVVKHEDKGMMQVVEVRP